MRTKGVALGGFAMTAVFAIAAAACGGSPADNRAGTNSGTSSGGPSSSSGTGSNSSGGSSGSSSGGSSSGPSSGSSGGSTSSGSGSSSGSSGEGGYGSGGGSGTLYFEQCFGGEICESPSFAFSAQFIPFGYKKPTACVVTTSGACSYYDCPGTIEPQGIDAGTLTISGGALGAPVTIQPDGAYNYTFEATDTLFSGGQALSIFASGATVPTFGPLSVVAPGAVTLSEPAAPYAIPTSADFPVAWTGGETGATFILEGQGERPASYFYCSWDASLGSAVVPQAVLAPLAGQSNGYVVTGSPRRRRSPRATSQSTKWRCRTPAPARPFSNRSRGGTLRPRFERIDERAPTTSTSCGCESSNSWTDLSSPFSAISRTSGRGLARVASCADSSANAEIVFASSAWVFSSRPTSSRNLDSAR